VFRFGREVDAEVETEARRSSVASTKHIKLPMISANCHQPRELSRDRWRLRMANRLWTHLDTSRVSNPLRSLISSGNRSML
jgi:hypothetical protein